MARKLVAAAFLLALLSPSLAARAAETPLAAQPAPAQGRGAPPDRARAYYWLALAMKQGANLDAAAQARDELAPKRSPGELAEAQRMLATTAPPAGEPRWAPLLASPAAMPKQAEFCASLARVMAAATAGLETLCGKARENQEWDATETLPGTHGCAIETSKEDYASLHSYRCIVSAEADEAVASADLESLRRLVSQCVGESWHVGEIRHPESHSVFFNRERGEPSLQLTDMSFMGRHDVGLLVHPPGVAVTLKGWRAGEAINLNAPMDVKAKDEGVGNVFSAIGEALAADVFIDAEVHGRVTLERKDAPLHEVLDAVCAQAGCAWSLETGGPRPQLAMQRKKS